MNYRHFNQSPCNSILSLYLSAFHFFVVTLQGQTYGIPTMQGGVETIRPYVDEFIQFANKHPEMTFLVTEIGCGIAGFTPQEIAPLFAKATTTENIHLPQRFWDLLGKIP